VSLKLTVLVGEVSHLLEGSWGLALTHVLVLNLLVAVALLHSVFLGTIPRVHFWVLVISIVESHIWGPGLLLVAIRGILLGIRVFSGILSCEVVKLSKVTAFIGLNPGLSRF